MRGTLKNLEFRNKFRLELREFEQSNLIRYARRSVIHIKCAGLNYHRCL
jgi:hypothetical protein